MEPFSSGLIPWKSLAKGELLVLAVTCGCESLFSDRNFQNFIEAAAEKMAAMDATIAAEKER